MGKELFSCAYSAYQLGRLVQNPHGQNCSHIAIILLGGITQLDMPC
jgi:hypothetical protein